MLDENESPTNHPRDSNNSSQEENQAISMIRTSDKTSAEEEKSNPS